MVIREMHIGVNLILQKINSSILPVIREEEMDFFLNNEIARFVNQRIRAKSNEKNIGFQKDRKRFEDLESLIVFERSLNVYVKDDKTIFAIIPSDCLRSIKDKSRTKDLCGAIYNPTTSTELVYYNVYKLLNTGVNNYQNFQFKIDGVIIFDTNLYPQFSSGLPSPEAKFEMIDFMLENIRRAGYEAFYENYLDKFYRESIIITSLSSNIIITVVYNGGSPIVTNPSNDSYTKVNTVTNSNLRDNELIATDEFNLMMNSSFGTTTASNPLSTLERGKIIVGHKKKFIISSVTLDYIRFPRKVSLPLNQSCDLNPLVHQEIVDNIAKRLGAITSVENYQQLLRENLLKE